MGSESGNKPWSKSGSNPGRLLRVRRYPVKSMLGEDLDAADVTMRGIVGDRTHALIDAETGKIASAKNPRLWANLLRMKGSDALRTTDDELSRAVGRRVRLVSKAPEGATLDRSWPDEILAKGLEAEVGFDVSRVAPGTFFDFAPLHILTSATIERLKIKDIMRYRPNLVLDLEMDETDLTGQTIHIGESLRVRVIVPTPRCAIPTLAHGDLPRDIEALRTPSRLNRLAVKLGQLDLGLLACAGVYAEVLRPGRVNVGDSLRAMAD
jgi:uncharacterized protein